MRSVKNVHCALKTIGAPEIIITMTVSLAFVPLKISLRVLALPSLLCVRLANSVLDVGALPAREAHQDHVNYVNLESILPPRERHPLPRVLRAKPGHFLQSTGRPLPTRALHVILGITRPPRR